jgi:hypothetical protein
MAAAYSLPRRHIAMRLVRITAVTATKDLFPASDKGIAATIPVYLSVLARVRGLWMCSGEISEVRSVCDAGNAM